MVKEELGVAILPKFSVGEDKDVKCIELDPTFNRSLGLIYREKDFKCKNELKSFVEYIKSFNQAFT